MADAEPLWTTADRDALKAAVLDLATGKRTVSVTFSSGGVSRARTFGIADLPTLRALLAEANRAVAGGPAYRLAATDKGLGA